MWESDHKLDKQKRSWVREVQFLMLYAVWPWASSRPSRAPFALDCHEIGNSTLSPHQATAEIPWDTRAKPSGGREWGQSSSFGSPNPAQPLSHQAAWHTQASVFPSVKWEWYPVAGMSEGRGKNGMSFRCVKSPQSWQAHSRCFAGVGSYGHSYYCCSYLCPRQPCSPEPALNSHHLSLFTVMPFWLKSTMPGTIIIGIIHHVLWIRDLLHE